MTPGELQEAITRAAKDVLDAEKGLQQAESRYSELVVEAGRREVKIPKTPLVNPMSPKAVPKSQPETLDDTGMAGECLSMIREKLARVIPMEHCPPMLYPEAIQNIFVWKARASRDCQVEHSWHHGDETLASKCIKGKVGEYAAKKHGV